MSKIALFRTKLFQVVFIMIVVVGAGVVFAVDSDNDGMSDLYETFFRLSPTNSMDAVEHHDSDLLSNLQESKLWTDPKVADTDADGWPDHADSNALSRAVIMWGHPDFTEGSAYSYTGPDWWTGAKRIGGEWQDGFCWYVPESNDWNAVEINFDRTVLTKDLMVGLLFEDTADSVAKLRLYDDQSNVVLFDLVGDITTGTGTQVFKRIQLPLAAHTNASQLKVLVPQNCGPFRLYSSILYVDEDADGLDDAQELQVGSSDHSADTDGDVMDDFTEVIIAGTDPANTDTDGDGLSDAIEFNGSVYTVMTNLVRWQEAFALAENDGGHLATISSEEEHNIMLQFLGVQHFTNDHLWIGGTDEVTEGDWQWITGEPFGYQRWAWNQPDNKNDSQHYLAYSAFNANQQWSDFPENYSYGFIVESYYPLDALNPDTDGDGISDGDEVEGGTNPVKADSDGDGLPDGTEIIRGTDPKNADTDTDGLSDSEEAVLGTDPLAADTDGDGLLDGVEIADAGYSVIEQFVSWSEALADAQSRGGHLATIVSEEEHIRLVESMGEGVFTNLNLWIGLNNEADENVWEWITGEDLEYHRWMYESLLPRDDRRWAIYKKEFPEHWVDYYGKVDGYILERVGASDPLLPDTDGDGLSDGEEVLRFTDPSLADTDGDGLSDGDEAGLGSDPLKVDSDLDGLSDGVEAEFGTDLLSSDSDGDGLSDSLETAGSIYRVIRSKLKWHEAQNDAVSRGGYLATITSEAEHLRLIDFIGADSLASNDLWIGASDELSEGNWTWVTGEAFAYNRWGRGEPNNYNGVEHWATYNHRASGGLWNDSHNNPQFYILERDVQLNPLNPDMDGDGLSDGEEVRLGVDPLAVDSDLDGVGDGDEVAMGTDPTEVDSDQDGLSDSQELELGTDPSCADSDEDGMDDFKELTFRYQLVMKCLTWPEAKIDAELRGGHLVSIADRAEHDTIIAAVPPYSLSEFKPWIGASDEVEDGVWTWVTGEPMTYSAFTATDHFGNDRGEYWAHFKNAEEWDDWGDNKFYPYLIEYETPLDPLTPDSDCDGVPDGVELAAGSSPYSTDSDGDGLGDAYEISAGQDPTLADSDQDLLPDPAEELTDPLEADCDADGLLDGEEIVTLTDPLCSDSNTNGVKDIELVAEVFGADAVDYFASHHDSTWHSTEDGALELTKANGRSTATYVFEIEDAGMYRLAIQARWAGGRPPKTFEPRMQYRFDGQFAPSTQAVAGTGELPEYVCFTPWLTAGRHEIRLAPVIRTLYGLDDGFVIESVQVYRVDGVDADGNGVDDWVERCLEDGVDTDEDGLTDLDEIIRYGSDPLKVDSDGDGLHDGTEVQYGTELLDPDSDDDGVEDGSEVLDAMSNPLIGDFDGTSTDVLILPGAAFTNPVGNVKLDGSFVRIYPMRCSLEFTFDVSKGDVYRLNVSAAHHIQHDERMPEPSLMEVYVDGIYVDTKTVDSSSHQFVDVLFFLPWLNSGEHTVKLFWDNYDESCSLVIQQLRLQEMGGPDANENGIKDWVECYLDRATGIDAVCSSYFSPACIEGNATYVPLMNSAGVILDYFWSLDERQWWMNDEFPFGSLEELRNAQSNLTGSVGGFVDDELFAGFFETCAGQDAISTDIQQGAGARWFMNLPLSTVGKTTALVSFQNEGIIRKVETEWKTFNLLEHDGEVVQIRKGDSMKFTVWPENTLLGTFSLSVNDEAVCSEQLLPEVLVFTNAGSYTVSGTFSTWDSSSSASVSIEVIDGSFPEESPACMTKRLRVWTFEGMPSNAVYEVGEAVDLSVVDYTTTTNNQLLNTLSLKVNETLGEHWVVSRVSENGPVLDSRRINTCWSGANLDGYAAIVEKYEDYDVWEMTVTARSIPESVSIFIETIVAGVVFEDDFSTSRSITVADLDDQGEYSYRLTIPKGANHSACHTVKMYQHDEYIGAAFGTGEFVPGR